MHIDSSGNATGSASGPCLSVLDPSIRRVEVEMEGTGSFGPLNATSYTNDDWTFRNDDNEAVASIEATELREFGGPNGLVVETGQASPLSGEPLTGCSEVEGGTATRSAANNAIVIEGVDSSIPDLAVGGVCPEE
ncbi:hypothetical protein ACH429_19200 [Streptomyces pathocidini]|uniref:Uncharacterized protein n=1 Tax=Streptomyces pathocidini TaxID=1650571 RepID=A0ABW7UWV7_9ACTN|nr:hypothetical protein [Streptomyces pathocidini]